MIQPNTRLEAHRAEYEYKRGKHTGDAPADKSRRTKNHYRVTRMGGGDMGVVFHNTTIIQAKANGHLILDCQDWAISSTTREALNYGLFLCGVNTRVGSRAAFGLSPLCVQRNGWGGAAYIYYDGIDLNALGEVVSTPVAFKARRIDRTATKALADGMKEVGFKDMFKLLHATCTEDDREEGRFFIGGAMREVLISEHHANQWKSTVARHSFEMAGWSQATRTMSYRKRTATEVWSSIMASAKQDLYNDITTDVFCVSNGLVSK